MNCCPSNLLSVSLSSPPPLPVWISILYNRIQCVWGGEVWGSGPQTDKHLAPKSLSRSILLDGDILHCLLWVLSFYVPPAGCIHCLFSKKLNKTTQNKCLFPHGSGLSTFVFLPRLNSQRSKIHSLASEFFKDFSTLRLAYEFLSQNPKFLLFIRSHWTNVSECFVCGFFFIRMLKSIARSGFLLVLNLFQNFVQFSILDINNIKVKHIFD